MVMRAEVTGSADPGMPERIGPLRVEGEIGRGGMGVVYRAFDERLARLVAIKVLSGVIAGDAVARERIQREARVLASVNHPNVAVIHAIEEAGGRACLVMEHVDGETLSSRLERGAMPVAEALRTCAQVAAALEAIHARGVVHRDLKPGNVKLRPDGVVKVLDFGLADLVGRGDACGVGASGESEGTPGYMSPEQVRGEPLDHRADTWALGCLLYECLAGRPAFPGGSVAERARATLDREPDWRALPVGTPDRIEELLRRCVEKDVARRLASIGDARTELEAAVAPAPAGPARRAGNLPAALSSFIGRERELGELEALLKQTRLLTLTGAGGCGKTRLALELATRQVLSWPDGAWLVELAALSDPELVPSRVASALGLKEQPGRTLEQVLEDWLEDRELLIILDNCEHLLVACAKLVGRLLHAALALRILVTSREALGVAGETAWRVPSLDLPGAQAALPLDELRAHDAIRLFEERAGRARTGFRVTAQRAEAVAEICRRVDGIPLAIELAAARLRMLTPDQVLEKLSDRFRLLTGGRRTALERHQTLHATLDWSYGLLTERERRCLRQLGAFAGGFTLEAATAVVGLDENETLDLLTHLADKSLIVAEDAGPSLRFRMLESIQQHAREKLDEAGEGVAARNRHRDFFVAFVEEANRRLLDDQQAWLSSFDREHDNVRAALVSCGSDPGAAEAALRLAGGCLGYWDWRGHCREGRQRLDAALALDGAQARTKLRAGALGAAGWLASREGDGETARALSEQSLEIAREVGDASGVAFALGCLGKIAQHSGDLATARALLAESLAIRRELGDPRGIAGALNGLANVAEHAGDVEVARALHEESLAIRREIGDSHGVASSLCGLGPMLWRAGDRGASRALYEEGLEIFRRLGDSRNVAVALTCLGAMAEELGELATARGLFEEALAIDRDLGDKLGVVMLLYNLAVVALDFDDLGAARRLLADGLARSRAGGFKPMTTELLRAVARLLAGEGEARRPVLLFHAARVAREALGLVASADRAPDDGLIAIARSSLGEAAFASAWEAGAALTLDEAVDLALAPARLHE